MRKKLTAMFLSFCMVSVFMPQSVMADDVLESGDLLTDGEDVSSGAVTELAEEIAKRTEKEVRKMQEEKAAWQMMFWSQEICSQMGKTSAAEQ